jgi:hypothetical protein
MLRTSIKQDTVARSRAAAAGFTSTLRSCDPLTAKIGVPCGWDHLHAWPPTCPPKAPMRPSLREIPSDPCCQAQEHRRSDFALKPNGNDCDGSFFPRLRALCNAPVDRRFGLVLARLPKSFRLPGSPKPGCALEPPLGLADKDRRGI